MTIRTVMNVNEVMSMATRRRGEDNCDEDNGFSGIRP